MLVWAADSAAYFAGRRFGKRKLAPYVSPGKTREGVYAALAVTGLAVAVGAVFLGLDASSNLLLILLTLVTVSASVSGDLCESWLKRRRAIKDSGALLPGHGGMLDRIDSMTAAAPVFALGLTWLGLPT
jgi:phosphatidate cytidylyltransferase